MCRDLSVYGLGDTLNEVLIFNIFHMDSAKKPSPLGWVVLLLVLAGLGYFVFNQQTVGSPSILPQPVLAPVVSTSTTEAPVATSTVLVGEVTLGAVLPLTGDSAQTIGVPVQKAIALAVDELNASGGVAGKKLVMVYADGKCDDKASGEAATKLIADSKVSAIIGGVCPGETMGLVSVATDKKIVVISPSETASDISTKGGEYVFRFAPSSVLSAKASAMYALKELNAKRAAIVSEDTPGAQELRNMFKQTFDRNGGGVVIDDVYKTKTTDFRDEVKKIMGSKIDVIYIVPQTPVSGLALLKVLKIQKAEEKVIVSQVLLDQGVAKNNAAQLEGVYGLIPAVNEQTDSINRFSAAFVARYGEALSLPIDQSAAYSAVYALKDQLVADPTQLQGEIASLKNWNGGAISNITLDVNGDIEWSTFAVKMVQQGMVTSTKMFQL